MRRAPLQRHAPTRSPPVSDSDWLENLGTLAIGAYFVLSHLYRVVKAQQQRQIPAEDEEVVVPLPQQARPRPSVPLPLPSPPARPMDGSTDSKSPSATRRRAGAPGGPFRRPGPSRGRGDRGADPHGGPCARTTRHRIAAARGDAFAAAASFDELRYQLSHVATQLKVLSVALDLPPTSIP